MLFSIINPPDPYTMEAPTLEVAAIAVCLLGRGKYGLDELTGDKSGSVPLFITGGHDEWFTKQFGRTFEQSLNHIMTNHVPDLVKTLASVYIGDVHDKRAFEEDAAKCDGEEAFTALLYERHDARRSSMNDIGRVAWGMADQLMAQSAAKDEGGHD